MATSLKQVVGGGGAGFKLAPDLNYISNNDSPSITYKTINVDPSGSLTTALSLSGKYAISGLVLTLIANEDITVKLTIDGVVIINETIAFDGGANGISVLGEVASASPSSPRGAGIITVCEESLLLELETVTDTSVNVTYIARPIL